MHDFTGITNVGAINSQWQPDSDDTNSVNFEINWKDYYSVRAEHQVSIRLDYTSGLGDEVYQAKSVYINNNDCPFPVALFLSDSRQIINVGPYSSTVQPVFSSRNVAYLIADITNGLPNPSDNITVNNLNPWTQVIFTERELPPFYNSIGEGLRLSTPQNNVVTTIPLGAKSIRRKAIGDLLFSAEFGIPNSGVNVLLNTFTDIFGGTTILTITNLYMTFSNGGAAAPMGVSLSINSLLGGTLLQNLGIGFGYILATDTRDVMNLQDINISTMVATGTVLQAHVNNGAPSGVATLNMAYTLSRTDML